MDGQEKYSTNNYIVESSGSLHTLLKQEIIDEFGCVARPDYNGEYKKSLQNNSSGAEPLGDMTQTD